MSTIFSSSWEGGGARDNNIWTGTAGDTPSILSVATDQVFAGAYSLKCTCSFTNGNVYLNESPFMTVAGVRFAIRIHSNPNINARVFYLSGALVAFWVTPTGTFFYDNGNGSGDTPGAIIGSSYAFSLDTWYQIELLYNASNGSMEWKVWDATGKNKLADNSGTALYPAQVQTFYLGTIYLGPGTASKGQTITYWADALVIDNSAFPGPLITATSFYPFPSFKPSY
jgi:hypothetical protein